MTYVLLTAGTPAPANSAMSKVDQETASKLVQLLENQLQIWKDFHKIGLKNPDLLTKIQENLIKKLRVEI